MVSGTASVLKSRTLGEICPVDGRGLEVGAGGCWESELRGWKSLGGGCKSLSGGRRLEVDVGGR